MENVSAALSLSSFPKVSVKYDSNGGVAPAPLSLS